MYVKNAEIKTAVKTFLSNHGFIKRIFNDDHETIGFIVRKEIDNSNDESTVLFNISFNKLYNQYKNQKNVYTLNEYKFFAIQHVGKISDLKKTENVFNINNNENKDKLLDYIKDYINNIEFVTNILSNTNVENMINYLNEMVLNTEKYYKNKKINVYFTINI